MLRYSWIAAFLLLAACTKQSMPVVIHDADNIPDQLSAWGVVQADGEHFTVNAQSLPYELNTPLFSDYAQKLRTVWMPPGEAAIYHASQEFEFPIGTVITKTFLFPKAATWSDTDPVLSRVQLEARLDRKGRLDLSENLLVETRLLVRYENGWRALPYVWNADQTEAWLEVAGDVMNLQLVDESTAIDFTYVVPDVNQCAACHAPNHTDADIRPIGLKARHLNRLYDYADTQANQIEHWQDRAVLVDVSGVLPVSANWAEPGDATISERARAYLDINCAHCHNSQGAADTSGLHLDMAAPLDRNFGICKSPTAVGQGSGDRMVDIYPGKPEESILMFRMEHTDPAIAMPELGRSTVHVEGVQLLAAWITSLEGDCYAKRD
jgi:uncharacterized repeat protein (TIGR03806 family)